MSLTDSDDESLGTNFTAVEATYLENEEIQGVSDDLLSMHGIAPGPKAEGVTRLIYETQTASIQGSAPMKN